MTTNTDTTPHDLSTVAGDGGNAVVSTEDLQLLKTEAMAIAKHAGYHVNERRWASEQTRHCLWEGQSPDGRKHADAQDGAPAFPFEGASDARLRLADMIVNEQVLVLVAAALRNLPQVKGLELNHEPLGHKLNTVLKWVLANKLGSDYVRELTKLAQYQQADSPAGAFLGIWWEQETALELRTFTLEELTQLLVQTFGLQPADLAQLDVQLQNPERDAETAEALQQLIPHLTAKRARTMVRQLRDEGVAEFPAPYLRVDQPALCAYRLFEDIFFPTNTTHPQRCRLYDLREWLSEVELRERIVSHGYTEEFVEEVLKHEAATAFPLYRRDPVQGDYTVIKSEESQEAYRGLYEVVTSYFRAVNEDHIPGIYYVPWHVDVDVPAHDRQLLEYKHGLYPFVYFSREILGSRLLDSRGVPELVATEQHAMKLLADSFNDNVTLSTLPNIKVPRRRSKLALVIGPLKVIKEDRPGDVAWMQPPQYPIGNDKQQQEIRRRVDEYFGRFSENVSAVLAQLHATGMVTLFLASLKDALTQLLQLCQQYMSDEAIQLITGEDGQSIGHSREDIQGKFSVELSFDPRDLDMDYLKTISELIISVILPADTLSTIQRDKLVQRLFMAINPSLAMDTIRPVESASQDEIKDETNYWTWIVNGVEPPMVESGQNFALRLQTLEQIVQRNPETLEKLSPMSRKIFQARVQYLQNQVQQLRNAQIGRQVGQPALEEGGGGGGQPAPMNTPGISGAAGGRALLGA